MKRALLSAMLVTVAACGDDVTELVVVIDSDLSVPADMDTVRVQVTGAASMTATGSLTGSRAIPLPRTVGVVHAGGQLGPVEITVQGLSMGAVVVERRVSTFFRSGKTLELPVFLSQRCIHVDCAAPQTCVNGACASAMVPADSLREWDGTPAGTDAGTGECTPVSERCNGLDDDCDRRVDEDFDLMSDPINCGMCGRACARAGATAECNAGTCVVTGCQDGRADCNGEPNDGCEVDLSDPANCGACGVTCALPNATSACLAAACAVASCDPGFDDCNTVPSDGCEKPLDTIADCGACGVACAFPNATAACTAGMCAIGACNAGFGDCNTDPTDGCETPLDTLTDCGACGTACDVPNGTETCTTGMCRIMTCDAGWADCNLDATDGCETPLNTLANCGMCGRACSVSNGTATCATGMCEIATCNADRGDCNMNPADGCEVDLTRTDAHCSMCGNACPAGSRCRFSVCT